MLGVIAEPNIERVHMNGRIYDPRLGRFLQADPMVQAPKNSQSLNRYSYVLNNPLSYTDPSGYIFEGISGFIRSFFRLIDSGGSWDAWGDLLQSTVALFGVSDNQSAALPSGTIVGSVSSQVIEANSDLTGVDAQQITDAFTDVTTATIGGTASKQTGLNFSNGADSLSFFEILGLEYLEVDDNSSDVVSNPELDALAVELLDNLPIRRVEEALEIVEVTPSAEPALASTIPRTGTNSEASVFVYKNTKAVLHTHVRSGSRRVDREREFPGPGDHVVVERGVPNFIRTPRGHIRVLERINGKFVVRTVRGIDAKGQADFKPGNCDRKGICKFD